MKTKIAVAVLLAVQPLVKAEQSVSWREIGTTVQIVGRLGVPIGTVVRIEATVISGRDLNEEGRFPPVYFGRYLRVDIVDGKPCRDRPIMFFDDRSEVDLELEDSSQKREEFEKRTPSGVPIGTVLSLWAFETASTSCNPNAGPEESFPFMSEMTEPEPHANRFMRTRLSVALPREAQPGATDNPGDAQ